MTVTGEPGLRADGSAARAGSAARSETRSDTRHGVTKRLCKQNLNIIGSVRYQKSAFIRHISTAAAATASTLHTYDVTFRVIIRRPHSLMPTGAEYVTTIASRVPVVANGFPRQETPYSPRRRNHSAARPCCNTARLTRNSGTRPFKAS